MKKFPFSEGAIALETEDISQALITMNKNKLLTINSQPRVHGVKSTHPKYGWGPENGYVYQKAYFELFLHPDLVHTMIEYLNQF
jgi:methylenetetrahydrofolate reductase (NADPH)